jgi:hypothetical protein
MRRNCTSTSDEVLHKDCHQNTRKRDCCFVIPESLPLCLTNYPLFLHPLTLLAISRFAISFRLDDSMGVTDFCSSFKIENVSNRSITLLGEKVEIDDPKVLYCQRVYRFSVEVWPAKTDSVFKQTKVDASKIR